MSFHFLTLPGLASSGPTHWQTIWEQQHPHRFHRIEQPNWDWPIRAEWVERVQDTIQKLQEPTILVAHSLGCTTVVHWAAEHYSPLVRGALLVAPADVEKSQRLSFINSFVPIPNAKLWFPSIVVASTDDRYVSLERAERFAENWGSEFVNIGTQGHINALSDLADWPDGKALLRRIGYLASLAYPVKHFD
ncbi:alpha/beta hydrolase [Rhabdobacter roseus]|uniref:Alpha/beta hydrolase n=1 Tax=Rhabdobacter roseus TaxID=1655419 RepID=A0A840TRG8_9BACT|nr:alpha/beta hydrolase [Rhabdobacter roseus]MBB5285904.1 hypothetical protein [Rhabdobacter roseus]